LRIHHHQWDFFFFSATRHKDAAGQPPVIKKYFRDRFGPLAAFDPSAAPMDAVRDLPFDTIQEVDQFLFAAQVIAGQLLPFGQQTANLSNPKILHLGSALAVSKSR
jgi:hypothetical protein